MIERIKQTTVASAGLVAFLMLASVASAQNKPKTAELSKPLIPLKVDVVFSEYEGAKKVSSLPYMLSANANDKNVLHGGATSLRMGLRVPFMAGMNQVQYQDIGTNFDCSAESLGTGAFKIRLSIGRSSAYSPAGVLYRGRLFGLDRKPASPGKAPSPAAGKPGIPLSSEPIFSRFNTELNLVMRDGQTVQSVMATDPVSGRVLRVDVTLHVVKDQ